MEKPITEQEMKDFSKAMKEWQEKQKKKKEKIEGSFIYSIYKWVKENECKKG